MPFPGVRLWQVVQVDRVSARDGEEAQHGARGVCGGRCMILSFIN